MRAEGYGPDKTLKVNVSTSTVSNYRDPAVILVDQLKQIYIEGGPSSQSGDISTAPQPSVYLGLQIA